MRKSIRCRLGWHKWVTTYSTDGSSRFLKCKRCPKETDFDQRPPLVASGYDATARREHEVIMRKPVRCLLGWHKWVTTYASDGTTRFMKCKRCPKESDFYERQWWTGQ